MKMSTLLRHFGATLLIAFASITHAADAVKTVRLYAFDCGRIAFKDLSFFSDTGDYDGKSGSLVDPCFLIRHPKGALLWDTGLGDEVAKQRGGVDNNGVHLNVAVSLIDQLAAAGLAPADITYVGFSHFHLDHTGNAHEFPTSTWIINRTEINWASSKPTPGFIDPKFLSAYQTAKTQLIDGDYDVFGDGSVRILKAPGHTPGHQVLMLKLAKTGTVILSGDLYHFRTDRPQGLVPVFNTSRADSLASNKRIEAIIKRTHARFVIQHNPEDFALLPKAPAYLD
jgi:N-acyl homoserine lactone hydrolase